MELLKQLNDAFSVCGYEDEIREVVKKYFSKHFNVYVDRLGNVIARKEGKGKHFVFLAPMDVPGAFLNVQKEEDEFFSTKLSGTFKVTEDCSARTNNGTSGRFFVDEKRPEHAYYKSEGESVDLPAVAEISVSFSKDGERVTSRHGALYALMKLSEEVCGEDSSFTFVALAQTSLRQRGAYGDIPDGADCYTLIEQYENERFKLGEGAILCLKDGGYVMPLSLKNCFVRYFENLLVCDEKPSLAGTLCRQRGGRRVASVKLPVSGWRTQNETFSLKDIDGFVELMVDIVKKG